MWGKRKLNSASAPVFTNYSAQKAVRSCIWISTACVEGKPTDSNIAGSVI